MPPISSLPQVDTAAPPRVTVILSLPEQGKDIASSLASVLGQTYQDWELIVLAPGPDAPGLEAIRRPAAADGRIRVVVQRPASGRNLGIPEGLALARGAYMAVLGAGDQWLPTKLQVQVRQLEEGGGDACFAGWCEQDSEGCLSGSRVAPGPWALRMAGSYGFLLTPASTWLVRRDRLQDAGDSGMNPGADAGALAVQGLAKLRWTGLPSREPLVVLASGRMASAWKADLGTAGSDIPALAGLRVGITGWFRRLAIQPSVHRFSGTCEDGEIPFYGFITTRMPFPPIGGDRLRAFHLLKSLTPLGPVRICCVSMGKVSVASILEALKGGYSVRLLQFSRRRAILHLAPHVFSSRPLQVGLYTSRRATRMVSEAMVGARGVLAVLVRSAHLAKDLPCRKVLDLTDSIGLHYLEAREHAQSLVWSALYRLEAPRLLTYEKEMVGHFDKTLLVNQAECSHFNAPSKVRWVTNGVNPDLLKIPIHTGPTRREVCFLGKMDYQPNIEACLWFMDKVMPALPEDLSFKIIGINPAPILQRSASRFAGRVNLMGFVPDPWPILAESMAVVAPLQLGGGVQNKLLEAMALGCPVLTTSKPANAIGLSKETSNAVLVLDTPEEYIHAIKRGLTDERAFQELRHQAREFILAHASWDEIYTEVQTLFLGA